MTTVSTVSNVIANGAIILVALLIAYMVVQELRGVRRRVRDRWLNLLALALGAVGITLWH